MRPTMAEWNMDMEAEVVSALAVHLSRHQHELGPMVTSVSEGTLGGGIPGIYLVLRKGFIMVVGASDGQYGWEIQNEDGDVLVLASSELSAYPAGAWLLGTVTLMLVSAIGAFFGGLREHENLRLAERMLRVGRQLSEGGLDLGNKRLVESDREHLAAELCALASALREEGGR